MKFIDEKGKLLGKINVIDFLVLLVLIAAIAVVGVRFAGRNKSDDNDILTIKFYTEEVNDFVADKVSKGVTLYDDTDDIYLGAVSKVERGIPQTWAMTSDGRYVPAIRDHYSSLIITGEVKGKKTDIGAEVNGVKYGVGHSMVLRAGDAKIYLRVYDIAVKEG